MKEARGGQAKTHGKWNRAAVRGGMRGVVGEPGLDSWDIDVQGEHAFKGVALNLPLKILLWNSF